MTSAQTPARDTTEDAVVASEPGTVSAPPPLRRNRDFQILWSGRAVSAIGAHVSNIAYPLLMLAATGSAGYAGMLAAAQMTAMLVVTLPAGLIADRCNRRALMLAADIGSAAAMSTLAVAVFTGHAPIGLIIATAIAASVCSGFFNPASGAALKQLVPDSQMAQAQAQNQARMHGAGLVGPPLGGWLFALGHAMPFLADAISYALAAVATLFIRTPLAAPADAPKGQGARGMTAGFRHLLALPPVRMLLLWALGINVAFAGFFLVLIATWRDRGASEETVGALMALSTAGGLLGALFTGRLLRALRPSRLILLVAWGLPVLLTAMAFVPGVLPLAGLAVLATVLLPALNAVVFSYVITSTPDALQGRVNAATNFLAMALQPLGPLVLGTVFDQAGAGWAFLIMAATCAVAAVPTLSPRTRMIPGPEEAAAA